MANFIKTISSRISEAFTKVKFYRYGKSDIQETKQATPFGIDSNPIADMTGLYIKTDVQGETILVGYINKNAIADTGEVRIFSTDADGLEKTYCHFKNDGYVDFNGSDGNLVRFNQLQSGFNQLKTDFNNLITLFNAHQHISAAPASPTSTPTAIATSSTASIDTCKINSLRTTNSN